MQNFIFSRARQSSAVRNIHSNAMITHTFVSGPAVKMHGVQAKPSGACTISQLGSSFERQVWTSKQ